MVSPDDFLPCCGFKEALHRRSCVTHYAARARHTPTTLCARLQREKVSIYVGFGHTACWALMSLTEESACGEEEDDFFRGLARSWSKLARHLTCRLGRNVYIPALIRTDSPGRSCLSQLLKSSASSGTVRSGRDSSSDLSEPSARIASRSKALIDSMSEGDVGATRMRLTKAAKKSTRLSRMRISRWSTMCSAAHCSRLRCGLDGSVAGVSTGACTTGGESWPVPFVLCTGVGNESRGAATASKLRVARRGKMPSNRPWAKESCLGSPEVAGSRPAHRSTNRARIVRSCKTALHSRPVPGLLRRTTAAVGAGPCGGGGSGQSTSSKSPRTLLPCCATATCGDVNQLRMKAARRPGMPERTATKPGEADALCSTSMPRTLAEGAGDPRACTSDSGRARPMAWSNGTGPRSLMARFARMVGSWL